MFIPHFQWFCQLLVFQLTGLALMQDTNFWTLNWCTITTTTSSAGAWDQAFGSYKIKTTLLEKKSFSLFAVSLFGTWVSSTFSILGSFFILLGGGTTPKRIKSREHIEAEIGLGFHGMTDDWIPGGIAAKMNGNPISSQESLVKAFYTVSKI